MEWYMIIVYGILIFGAISSFLNYRLQKDWYERTHSEGPYKKETPSPSSPSSPYKTEPSVSERKI